MGIEAITKVVAVIVLILEETFSILKNKKVGLFKADSGFCSESITLHAIEIGEQYKRRGDAENKIKELKEDFGVQGFCIDDFCATETAMRFVMIGYNLMSLYRRVRLQKQPNPTKGYINIQLLCS